MYKIFKRIILAFTLLIFIIEIESYQFYNKENENFTSNVWNFKNNQKKYEDFIKIIKDSSNSE